MTKFKSIFKIYLWLNDELHIILKRTKLEIGEHSSFLVIGEIVF